MDWCVACLTRRHRSNTDQTDSRVGRIWVDSEQNCIDPLAKLFSSWVKIIPGRLGLWVKASPRFWERTRAKKSHSTKVIRNLNLLIGHDADYTMGVKSSPGTCHSSRGKVRMGPAAKWPDAGPCHFGELLLQLYKWNRQGSGENVDSGSVGLESGLRFCVSNKLL